MMKFVTVLFQHMVDLVDHPTVTVPQIAQFVNKLKGRNATMFQDRSAQVFQDSNATMFPDRWLERNATQSQDNNVTLYHKRFATVFPDNNAQMFLGRSAKVFQDK